MEESINYKELLRKERQKPFPRAIVDAYERKCIAATNFYDTVKNNAPIEPFKKGEKYIMVKSYSETPEMFLIISCAYKPYSDSLSKWGPWSVLVKALKKNGQPKLRRHFESMKDDWDIIKKLTDV